MLRFLADEDFRGSIVRGVLQLDPDVRVIFASGYSAENISGPGRERVLGFLAKPYCPDRLTQAVRSALDRHNLRAATGRPSRWTPRPSQSSVRKFDRCEHVDQPLPRFC